MWYEPSCIGITIINKYANTIFGCIHSVELIVYTM